MDPIYVHLEKLQRGLITRREFFKRAAVLGFTTPAVVAALQGCVSPIPPQASRDTSGPTRKIAPDLPPAGEIRANPIIFRGWAYETDVVEDNVKKFVALYDENVDYRTVTGDYGLIIDTSHITKQPLDMYYGNESNIARHAPSGNLLDYEMWWDIDKAKAEMYPAFKDAWTWRDGKLYGLPYYTAVRATIMINRPLLQKAGLEHYELTTWDDFYDLCRRLKKDRVAEYPLLHHWFGTIWATTWQFLWECHNRGIKLFDHEDGYRPLFDQNHESVKVLENWQALFAEGIHPASAFNMQEGDYIDAFAKGEFVFSPQQTYDNKRFNDPAKSRIAGMVDWATPPKGKPWGKFEMGGYLLANRPRDDKQLARVLRHNTFYGYRDKNGALFVAKRWAIEKALNSGYREILEDKDVLAAYQSWMPGGERQFNDMKTYFSQVVWDPFYHCPWISEFLRVGKAELEPVILGSKAPKEAIENMRGVCDKLFERFKSVAKRA